MVYSAIDVLLVEVQALTITDSERSMCSRNGWGPIHSILCVEKWARTRNSEVISLHFLYFYI